MNQLGAFCPEIEDFGCSNFLGPWMKAENSLVKHPLCSPNSVKSPARLSPEFSSHRKAGTEVERTSSDSNVGPIISDHQLLQSINSPVSTSMSTAPPNATSDGMASRSYPTMNNESAIWTPNTSLKPTNLFPDITNSPKPNKTGPINSESTGQNKAHGNKRKSDCLSSIAEVKEGNTTATPLKIPPDPTLPNSNSHIQPPTLIQKKQKIDPQIQHQKRDSEPNQDKQKALWHIEDWEIEELASSYDIEARKLSKPPQYTVSRNQNGKPTALKSGVTNQG
ncbi:hypothetical protein CASFOL_029113 [Castilleja foliolosa]|uniref:Prolactin receptor n=1 Tax=Castilleja foliolosa TaxID=1961234 RepID=A0ABD3CCY7_9LAMI